MNTGDREKPRPRQPRLKQAPKLRDLYWCDFPQDAHLPEMWKRRPVIVIAGDRRLSGHVTVIPCSSQPQDGNRWAYPLTTTIDGKGPSWAICDKLSMAAVSRLSIDIIHHRPRRVTEEEFTAVLGLVNAWLPKLKKQTAPIAAEAAEVVPRPADLSPARPAAELAT